MHLPSKKRPGNPILAKDWNMLIDALEARTPRPGPGMEIVSSSGGFTFRVKSSSPGGGGVKIVPLAIIGARPPYIAPSSPLPPNSSSRRYYIEWGTLNNLVAQNWNAHFDVSSTTYFFAKASLRTVDSFQVTNWEIVTGSSFSSHTTPDWPVGAPRPAHAVVLLGTVFVNNGGQFISQSGGGSIVMGEHIATMRPGSGAGDVLIGKQITYHRLTY
jgi:hypothetical protein